MLFYRAMMFYVFRVTVFLPLLCILVLAFYSSRSNHNIFRDDPNARRIFDANCASKLYFFFGGTD